VVKGNGKRGFMTIQDQATNTLTRLFLFGVGVFSLMLASCTNRAREFDVDATELQKYSDLGGGVLIVAAHGIERKGVGGWVKLRQITFGGIPDNFPYLVRKSWIGEWKEYPESMTQDLFQGRITDATSANFPEWLKNSSLMDGGTHLSLKQPSQDRSHYFFYNASGDTILIHIEYGG